MTVTPLQGPSRYIRGRWGGGGVTVNPLHGAQRYSRGVYVTVTPFRCPWVQWGGGGGVTVNPLHGASGTVW